MQLTSFLLSDTFITLMEKIHRIYGLHSDKSLIASIL